MISTDIYDTTGKVTGKASLPESVFGAKINPILMAQAVKVYLSNQRKAHAKAKTRGEVSRTKAKVYRQKGTGRARHGARSAPIYVGGGKAHGPTGEQNFERTLPQKMRKQSLFSALTSKLKSKEVVVVNSLEKVDGKTSQMKNVLDSILGKQYKKVLLVLPKKDEKVTRAGRNIPNLKIRPVSILNTYEVLNGGMIIFSKDAVSTLSEVVK